MRKTMGWLSLLLSEVSDLAFICDRGTKIKYMNAPFQSLAGSSCLGRPFPSIFPERDSHWAKRAVGEALGGQTTVCELSLNDDVLLFRMKPLCEGRDISGVLGVAQSTSACRPCSTREKEALALEQLIQERTEELINTNECLLAEIVGREKMEHALKDSELKYRDLLEANQDAVLVADTATGVIIDANSRACELLGRPVNKLVGLHQANLHPEKEMEYSKTMFQRCAGNPAVAGIRLLVKRGDGKSVPVEISSRLTTLEGRTIVHGFFRDLSE